MPYSSPADTSLNRLALWLGYVFNWRIVRAIAELQVLTRVSYGLLVAVPICAFLWPSTLHDKKASGSALGPVEDSAPMTAAGQVGDLASTAFTKEVPQTHRSWLSDLREWASGLRFPGALASGFFAALFAAVGHLIYQVFAPDSVRGFTLDDFVRRKKRDFSEQETAGALAQARKFEESTLGRREFDARYRNLRAELRRLDRLEGADARLRELEAIDADTRIEMQSVLERLATNKGGTERANPELLQLLKGVDVGAGEDELTRLSKLRKLSVVERGAKIEYLTYSRRNLAFAVVSSLIYGFAILIVVGLVANQSFSIMDKAGWDSIWDAVNFRPEIRA